MRNSVCVATAARSGRRDMAGVLARGMRKVGLAAGAALAVSLCAATGAQAQCTSTIPSVSGFSAASFAPFSTGSSLNSLVSAINAANTVFLTQSTGFIGSPSNPQPDQTGGGVWARSIGGEQTTKGTTSSSYSLLGVPVSGSTTCQTRTQLSFGGVQIGTDVSTLNVDGWNLHLGSTLGYLGATGKDTTNAGPLNPFGGTFSDNLQIPFVGLYGVATKGSLFVDGQARWLYIQDALSDAQDGLFGQHLDARGIAINGDVGYNIQLQNNWFVEPSAGFIWSETSVDPLNTAGTFVLGTGVALPAQVSISEIYSAIGRVGVRAGTTVDEGSVILQPFGTASFFREFQGNPTATANSISSVPGVPAATGSLATTGIGNYGQFGLGVAGQIKDTGWLGYIRADYRTGDNIQGWSLNGGVRYQFDPGRIANPLFTKGPAPEPVAASAPYNWTGFRVGAVLGADWGYTNWNFVPAGSGATSPRFAGILPGGLIGYDYQIGKWVVGAGADMGWTNANGASGCPNSSFLSCENKADWLATVTGRLGYAFWGDRVLSYAKAGLALGEFETTITCNTAALPLAGLGLPILNSGCPSQSLAKTSAGWTVGGGTEFALTQNWSVRAETSYFDLGNDHYSPLSLAGGDNSVNVSHHGYIATIGLSYRFDIATPGPVAKY